MSETQTPANEDFLRDFVELQRKVADISNASVSGNQLATGDMVYSFAATRTGCLLCDGSIIFDTDWPALTAYIRANVAALIVDGVSVHLPDGRGLVLGGAGGGGFVLGTATGVAAVTLTSTQSGQPGIAAGITGAGSSHTHPGGGQTGTESATHTHGVAGTNFVTAVAGGASGFGAGALTIATSGATGTESATHTHSDPNTGAEAAHTHTTPAVAAASAAASHTNVQPTLPANLFVKT